MALRQIRMLGDEILTKHCREVKELTPRLKELIGDMLETMYDANGVGLSAPQVGVLRRIVVIDVWQEGVVDESAEAESEEGKEAQSGAESTKVPGSEPEKAAEEPESEEEKAPAAFRTHRSENGPEAEAEPEESVDEDAAEDASEEESDETAEDSEDTRDDAEENAEEAEDGEDVTEGPLIMVNPVITYTEGEQTGDEGCLSLPGKAGKVTRPMFVRATYFDENMEEYEIEAEGLLARAICHEVDHLEGHMYVELVEGEIHDVGVEPEGEENSESTHTDSATDDPKPAK